MDAEVVRLLRSAVENLSRRIRKLECAESIRQYSNASTSNPPTAAELNTAFGTAAEVGNGYVLILDNGGAGTSIYLIASNGVDWWYTALTKSL
jgi:pyruvate/2-oxoacid:ferredoxin oxidoreductase beta subunit